jgi:serine/threonine protein kinase
MDHVKVSQPNILVPSSAQDLRSEITYELVAGPDPEGNHMPVLLGRGRFAKVYKAWQRSAGYNVRPVAIKILHENMDRRAEQLFLQEIRLLKTMTAASTVNVISILDILQLGPMAMCGSCGQIYHPRCPQCGEFPLERYDPPQEAWPALRCGNHTQCRYMVSGEHILNGTYALLQAPAKTCCSKDKGTRAQRGTLINFVDRDAVVMEVVGQGLQRFHQSRRRTYVTLGRQFGIDIPGLLEEGDELPADPSSPPTLRPAEPHELAYVQKSMLLEKVLLMVQLAEAVAWLHGEQQIIHKDLAPDNIMVEALPDEDNDDEGVRMIAAGGFLESLTNLITCPRFAAKVIDFGLADYINLSRHWYEEPLQNFATEKLSFLSVEARGRKRRIYQKLEFDIVTRQFIVPDSLRPDKAGELSIKPGDLLVEESDQRQLYCLEVTQVFQDPNDRRIYRASYTGELPPNSHTRQFDLVHRLGEAHDLYALGAVFFYILTSEVTVVGKLTNIAGLLQDAQQSLRAETLLQNVPSYALCRDHLPEKCYQDEVLILCLRAMVRGQEESFVSSRIERGPEPARRFLSEVRGLYNRIKSDVLSEPLQRRLSEVDSLRVRTADEQQRQLQNLRGINDTLIAEHQRAEKRWQRRQHLLFGSAALSLLLGAAGGYLLNAGRGVPRPADERPRSEARSERTDEPQTQLRSAVDPRFE